MRLLLALLVLASAAGCSDWRDRVRPGVAVPEPASEAVADAEPIALTRHGTSVRLLPRARYRTKAWVVAADDNFQDGAEDVMSVDLGLAWGVAADPAVLKQIRFHLKRRYLSARWDAALTLPETELMSHISNHHLIPRTDLDERRLLAVRPGDLVTLEGYLVDVEGLGDPKRTSLSRDDKGSGACEILYVERLEVGAR